MIKTEESDGKLPKVVSGSDFSSTTSFRCRILCYYHTPYNVPKLKDSYLLSFTASRSIPLKI